MFANPALQVGTAQILHNDVVGVAVLAPIVYGNDVGALQRGCGLGFLLEARGKRLVVGVLRQHDLYANRAPENLVEPSVHDGHATSADFVLNGIAPA